MTNQLVIFTLVIFFFIPPTLNLKKKNLNQLIKKIWPILHMSVEMPTVVGILAFMSRMFFCIEQVCYTLQGVKNKGADQTALMGNLVCDSVVCMHQKQISCNKSENGKHFENQNSEDQYFS